METTETRHSTTCEIMPTAKLTALCTMAITKNMSRLVYWNLLHAAMAIQPTNNGKPLKEHSLQL